jgi:hypothetical protein
MVLNPNNHRCHVAHSWEPLTHFRRSPIQIIRRPQCHAKSPEPQFADHVTCWQEEEKMISCTSKRQPIPRAGLPDNLPDVELHVENMASVQVSELSHQSAHALGFPGVPFDSRQGLCSSLAPFPDSDTLVIAGTDNVPSLRLKRESPDK